MAFLAKLSPYLVQFGEALLVGIGVGYGAYATGRELHEALIAGFGAFIAKLLPTQIAPSGKGA
jgi:hypothetical protein